MCGCPRAATIDVGDDDGDHDDGSDDVGEDDDDGGDRSSGGLPRHTHAVHDWGARVESSRTFVLTIGWPGPRDPNQLDPRDASLNNATQHMLTYAWLACRLVQNICSHPFRWPGKLGPTQFMLRFAGLGAAIHNTFTYSRLAPPACSKPFLLRMAGQAIVIRNILSCAWLT